METRRGTNPSVLALPLPPLLTLFLASLFRKKLRNDPVGLQLWRHSAPHPNPQPALFSSAPNLNCADSHFLLRNKGAGVHLLQHAASMKGSPNRGPHPAGHPSIGRQ